MIEIKNQWVSGGTITPPYHAADVAYLVDHMHRGELTILGEMFQNAGFYRPRSVWGIIDKLVEFGRSNNSK